MDFLKEFFVYLKIRKKYWLIPVVLFLMLFGGLLIVSESSVIAPFIYTVF